MLQWLREAGLNYHKLRGQFPPIYQIHFSSERKRMTTVVRDGDRLVVLAKGSPEWLLEHSTHYQAADGAAREWTPEAREAVRAALRDSAGRAMRTLAFGHAVLPADFPADADGLQRPPRRPGNRPRLRRLRRHPRPAARRREGRRGRSAARPASRSR